MRLRSDRHFSPLPAPQGGSHHQRQVHGSDDGISSLPKDLLLQVLVRLKSAKSAARAGAVSRRWRGLWTELPELTLFHVEPRMLEAVLSEVTRARLDLLDIIVTVNGGAQVASLLRAATRLAPEKLIFCVWDCITNEHEDEDEDDEDYSFVLPCFDGTSSLALELMNFHLLPPLSGEFTALKNLSLNSCRVNIGTLLSLCPSLRVLKMWNLIQVDTMIVHSTLLEDLTLQTTNTDFCSIDIVAPVLKALKLEVCLDKDFSLFFLAPMVTILEWICVCDLLHVGVNGLWKLDTIRELKQHGFHVVSLDIICMHQGDLLDAAWSFAQMIAQLPVPVFSVMELDLKTKGHAFGPLVLHLLQIRPDIQSFKLVLSRGEGRGQIFQGVSCPVNCPCEESSNWRSESISLPNLEVVEIHGMKGEGDEIDFLKLILRSATMLRRLTVRISDDVSPSDNRQEKMCGIMKEYPGVEYLVVREFFIHD